MVTPVFRKINRLDVYGFSKWGKHTDPRYFQYNMDFDHAREYDAWYYMKQRLLFRKVYGLFEGNVIIGFVTLKHIRWLKGIAELGIAIDPSKTGKGYGTLLLESYLRYVFKTYPIHQMSLKVAHFNLRAQRSYEKVGFIKVGEVYAPYEEQGYKDIIMTQFPDQFDLIDGILYTRFFHMKIDRQKFID